MMKRWGLEGVEIYTLFNEQRRHWGFPPDGKEERSLGNLMQQENMHGSARLTNAFLENLRSESQTILTARIATKVLYLLHNFMTWFKSYKIIYSDKVFKNFIWCKKNCCMILSTPFSTHFVIAAHKIPWSIVFHNHSLDYINQEVLSMGTPPFLDSY